ncbi:WD40-repeat-containing domain protein [Boletus coccyginus]|nr:WD40-repeat-containing domain protein [Boletus coccyginus]
MVESTTPSHQYVLLNSTNLLLQTQDHLLPTPSEDVLSKRRPSTPDETPTKRPRLTCPNGEAGDGDIESFVKSNPYRYAMFSLLQTSSRRPPSSPRIILPSRLILQSFVSSHRSDGFKCFSLADHTFVTPPYACAYSNSAKSCGVPFLAVATEEGSVSVLDTSKRREWDLEPQRATFQPHQNGIFDVKWSLDDSMLATASGDKSTRICSVEMQTPLQLLQTHTSSVKCIAWDPSHRDILSTGSRDGKICVWDLRVASSRAGLREGIPVSQPVMVIHDAHGQGKSINRRRKMPPLPRSVTSILYTGTQSHTLISSGSFDGILNLWDLRHLVSDDPKRQMRSPCASSPNDATTMNGSCRPRGISSLCAGTGPTSGLLFALGADSRLYTYSSPSLIPLEVETHPNLRTSFYVRLAGSICGRWLSSGCSGKNGSSFLFDISNAAHLSVSPHSRKSLATAVELRGQTGEVGAVDWAHEMLATCADDGTVRVWRPDYDVYQKCLSDPDAERWNWSWPQDAYP